MFSRAKSASSWAPAAAAPTASLHGVARCSLALGFIEMLSHSSLLIKVAEENPRFDLDNRVRKGETKTEKGLPRAL